jgi:hypothetical protein
MNFFRKSTTKILALSSTTLAVAYTTHIHSLRKENPLIPAFLPGSTEEMLIDSFKTGVLIFFGMSIEYFLASK